ncbi:MAG: DMT family transporter [Ilumatobacter sp.]|nr:DMT family transporter [Ilumatobacter sp.]
MGGRPAGSQRLFGLLAVVAAIVCFGMSSGIIKWPGAPGSVIAWWRLVGSSLLWWALVLTLRAGRDRPLPSKESVVASTPAALCLGLQISLFFTAVTKTSIAHAEFIAALGPLLIIPAGFLFFHEQPNWKALRWGALSVVGLAIVLLYGPDQGVATWQGDLLMGGVLILTVAYYSTSKFARAKGVPIVDFMATIMPLGLITATPVALVLAGDELWPLTWQTWVAIGLLSVLTGMAGHGLLFYAHRSVPIATISVMQVGQPALAAFWGWLIVGEAIAAAQVPGMVLVMVGIAMVVWSSQRSATRTATAATTTTTGRPAD